MRSNRSNHSAALKAKVAVITLKGDGAQTEYLDQAFGLYEK